MADRRRILRQWNQGSPAVLVTLVRAQGSSYRRPGAQLLVSSDGTYAGTISGGCLEAEVVRKAEWMVRNGAVVERYSTLFDDTAEIPFGLGCGGVVDLLLEPAPTPECRAAIQAIESSITGDARIVATWLPYSNRPMRRAVFDAASNILYRSEDLTDSDLRVIHSHPTANIAESIYIQRLSSPLRLFVLGAGDDAKPVVSLAALLGWTVIVADSRASLAKRDRFPEADRVLTTASATDLGITAADAVVIMTHSYEQDRALLAGLLGSSTVPGYIGLLGASHRSSLLVSEAAAMLGIPLEACCERVWAPVGLDLGGDGAEAIALAVVAEVQAWHQGKLSASRRLNPSRIAEQIAKGGASRFLQTQCALDTSK
jgi:xanthine dehydrogenase accessory factor